MMIGSTETEVTWSTTINLDSIDDATLHTASGILPEKMDRRRGRQSDRRLQEGWRKADNARPVFLILSTDVSNFRTGTDTEAER